MCALVFHAGAASALGLLQAYDAALQNDPTYRAALHENEAGRQSTALGRANLLPSVSINYSSSKNRTDVTAPNALGNQATNHLDYRSTAGAISLRQPILNLEGVARYRQGVAQAGYSDAQFSGRKQELVLRLVGAYADAQYAQDQWTLALAQRDAFAEQRRVNDRMFQQGEGSKTDMLETQAKLDLTEAQAIEARDNLAAARNALAAIVGSEVMQPDARLDTLSDDFHIKPMQPAAFDAWKAGALEHNAEIAAQRYAVEIAQQEINKNRAGHAPRLDLLASYGKNSSDTLSTLNQDATARSVGVQLSIPLYAGGAVRAATSQALANHEKAKAELEASTRKVLLELRKQHDVAASSAARIDALVKAVDAAHLLIQATRQSIKGGVRINLDLLNAQQQRYAALRDLAQARYNYLLSYLRLRFAAGTLNADDLREVAGYFMEAR